MEEINRKKALAAAKKKKINAAGRPGKISKDADFEKMFGKDIDEFLEDFDEKGSLKTALSGYSTKLSKDTWLIYLGNILNSLERMGKPPKKKTSIRGMKYAKSPKKKRNSGRYTRKTRR